MEELLPIPILKVNGDLERIHIMELFVGNEKLNCIECSYRKI
jgi:hypothetical protein